MQSAAWRVRMTEALDVHPAADSWYAPPCQVTHRLSLRSREEALQKALRELGRMTHFKEGWSYGEGDPISDAAVEAAGAYARRVALDRGFKVNAFPDLDGGCSITAYNGDQSVDLTFDVEGEPSELRVEKGIGAIFDVLTDKSSPSQQDVELALVELAEVAETCPRLSDYSICGTTIPTISGSSITRSVADRPVAEGAGSRLLILHVPPDQVSASASMWRGTTQARLATRRTAYGDSMLPFSTHRSRTRPKSRLRGC